VTYSYIIFVFVRVAASLITIAAWCSCGRKCRWPQRRQWKNAVSVVIVNVVFDIFVLMPMYCYIFCLFLVATAALILAILAILVIQMKF